MPEKTEHLRMRLRPADKKAWAAAAKAKKLKLSQWIEQALDRELERLAKASRS